MISEMDFDKINSKLDKFQAMIYKFMRDLEKKTPYSFYREYRSKSDDI